MRQETFTLSQKELQRVTVISRCVQGNLTCARAAELLALSPRHVKRLKSRYRQGSAAALAHVSRGRPSHQRTPPATGNRILALARTRYVGFNDHHLHEKLVETEGLSLSRETLRRLLRANGMGSPRKRRPPAHRQRRLRSAREGELVQLDGSPHDWLQGRGPSSPPWACRMMLPAKSSPLSSSPRKLPRAISACSTASCAATASPSPSTAIAAVSSPATTITGPSTNNSPASAHPLSSAALSHNSASPSSPPKLPKPKDALSASGACCKTVSPANFAWPMLAISTRPTPYCGGSLPITTAASLALPALPKRPGARLHKIWNASAASPTNASSATITSCNGMASGCKFIRSLAVTVSPEPKCRSIRPSTAASRSTTAILDSSIPTLLEGDIFTLPLG